MMRFKLVISVAALFVLSACDGGPDPDKVPRTIPPELLSAPQSMPAYGVGPIYEVRAALARREV